MSNTRRSSAAFVGISTLALAQLTAAEGARPAETLQSSMTTRLDFHRAYAEPDPAPAGTSAPSGASAGSAAATGGQTSAGGDSDLAMQLANPVADLISIPLQFNYDEGFGPADAGQYRLNIQPVIPFRLSEDWNLITRTIVPVIYRESLADGLDSSTGLGDTLQSFFFSPRQPVGGWILGAGPVVNWPTATENDLGSRKFGAGPTVVALRQESGWTYGLLANHVWSFAGESDAPEVNASFLQPFLSYTFPTATSLTLNTESSYDWTNSEWTVPINLVGGQIVKLGKLPVQLSLGGRYYADAPDGGPEWGLRFTFTILLPK